MKATILSIISLLFCGSFLKAQIVGTEAYFKGNYVEIGFDGSGGFEGADTALGAPPAGMHMRTANNYFGFVANPQMDGWVTYNGDFYTPGTPENGWGFEIGTSGGARGSNNRNYLPDSIPGSITSWTHTGGVLDMNWEGNATIGTNLHFIVNYHMNDTDLYYVTTVTIINNTTSLIPDLYYYRNLDPDNNEVLTNDFTTNNTIVAQHVPGTSILSEVTATQATPYYSYFALMALDTTMRVGYGGFSNRDASTLYQGTTGLYVSAPGSSQFADEAIFIANHSVNLAPGVPSSFHYAVVFDPGEIYCLADSAAISQAPLPLKCTSDAPFRITGGSPAGGIYSGMGVVNDTMFSPALSGPGNFYITYAYHDSVTGCTRMAGGLMTVTNCTGLTEEETAVSTVTVFPNPFSGSTTVSLKTVAKSPVLHIYDLPGREVRSVTTFSNGVFTVNADGLTDGIYLFRITDSNAVIGAGRLIVH